MSSHVHLGLLAGEGCASGWLKPLHTGVAMSLNRAERRLGPVFAERPRTIALSTDRAARLIAYLHNNPVRARLVRDPADSAWTTHRAFIGEVRPPAWLDVGRALSLCGFDSTATGRLAFHEFVRARSGDERDPALSGDGLPATRVSVRRTLGAPASSVPVTNFASSLGNQSTGEHRQGIWV